MSQTRSQALMAQFKLVRRLYLAYLLVAIGALVSFFFDKRVTPALLALCLIYHLALVRPKAKAYQRAYTHLCAQLTLERHLENASHTEQPVLTPQEISAVKLVASNTTKGAILCREGGTGTVKGCPVRLGDVTVSHSFPNNGKTNHQFITGVWTCVELGRDTGLDCRFLRREVMLPRSWEKMLSENPELERLPAPEALGEDFLLIRSRDNGALPTDAFLRRLKKLGEGKCPVALCIQGDKLHLLVVNRVLGQSVDIRQPPAEGWLARDIVPELSALPGLVEQL